MRKMVVHICSFSGGLDDLPKKYWGNPWKVLLQLSLITRFSIFEATADQRIARSMDFLVQQKYIEVDNSPGYPWSNVKLTKRGHQIIGQQKTMPAPERGKEEV